MLLLRTVCSTDWKGRPSHQVLCVARTEHRQRPLTRKAAIEAMDADVREWMLNDLQVDEENSDEEQRAEWQRTGRGKPEEMDRPTLEAAWKHTDRFEMSLTDADHREFVERMEGDFTTIVYHLLKDDFECTDRT